MKPEKKCCAFTGHRPAKLAFGYQEQDPRCVKLKQLLLQQITVLTEKGVTKFLSGMAQGVDLWAAELVLALREKSVPVSLTCVLPCETQADRWPAVAQARYQSVLRRADETIWVHRAYTPKCMLERDRYLVDNAQYVLAVYNGEARGGTAATVRYARKQGRHLTVIDPVSFSVTDECPPLYALGGIF